jgi:hypothetical protein
MQSADTCNWYTPALETQLCWYFECTREKLLAMLSNRVEERPDGDRCLSISFKTPQQMREREIINMRFDISPDGTPVFVYLDDWYYTGGAPEYRFNIKAPDPDDLSRLYGVGGGF